MGFAEIIFTLTPLTAFLSEDGFPGRSLGLPGKTKMAQEVLRHYFELVRKTNLR
jgi:hypothetical protein